MSFSAIAAFFMSDGREAKKRAKADRKFKEEFRWNGLTYDQLVRFIEDVCETDTLNRLLVAMPQHQYDMIMSGNMDSFYFLASTYIVEWTNSNWEWLPCITPH